MEPIQLQCGSCGQVMGISPAHLGAQVQCPHCQAVVQTPAPAGALGVAPGGATSGPTPQVGEQESIFSQPEPTDDLFGASAAPRVEMPPDSPPRQRAIQASAATVAMEPAAQSYEAAPDTAPAPFQEASEPADEDLETFTPQHRVAEGGGMFVPILLIFLVPYAIFSTGFVAYLLYNWPKPDNPLKVLPDGAPRGKPRQVEQIPHQTPLDKDMKTTLGQSIQVGDIEVTPIRIRVTPEQDLVLEFKAKNLSPNVIFSPISDDYMKYVDGSLVSGRPYTFLERVSDQKLTKLYGGYIEFFKGAGGKESFDGDIKPGEEAVVHLTTDVKNRKDVPLVTSAKEPLVWRVQVRRGLVAVDGKGVSATTVIGVEFTARDIVKDRDG